MKACTTLALLTLALALAAPAVAADISGKWTAQFDTQIGVQKYTYEFKVEGGKLTGKATSETASSEISEGKVSGDDVSFVENLSSRI
jgi:azurin